MSHKTRKHILNQSDCINKIRTAIYECMIEREPPSEEHLEKLNKRLVPISQFFCHQLIIFLLVITLL